MVADAFVIDTARRKRARSALIEDEDEDRDGDIVGCALLWRDSSLENTPRRMRWN